MWGVTVNWRASVSLLAATLLGGCIGIVLAQAAMVTPQGAVRSVARSGFASHSVPAVSAISGYVVTDASPSPALATMTAVLAQAAKDRWQTTVILTQAAKECPGPASDYWLETTTPSGAYRASSAIRVEPGPCRVTVTFNVALTTPQSALLVLDEAGVVSSTQLSLSREVRTFEKYGVPLIFGGVMVLILLIFISFLVRITGENGLPISPGNHFFWQQEIPVSDTDILKIGGISVATVLATLIAAAGFANSLFPGVSLSSFVILSIIFGMIVAAGPVIYELLHGSWLNRNGVYLAGVNLQLDPSNEVTIEVPSGADITLTKGSRRVIETGADGTSPLEGTFKIPPGSSIKMKSGTPLEIPDDSNCLQLDDVYSVEIIKNAGQLTDLGGMTIKLPTTLQAADASTITYVNPKAYITIPNSVRIMKGAKVEHRHTRNRRFTLTSDPEKKPAANMKIVVGTALCTTFGLGAELGLIGVLAVVFSDGGTSIRIISGLVVLAMALITLYYGFNTIQTAANNSSDGL